MLLEVIVQSVEDARAAALGGADRLEVVRDIAAGGLTPPIELVRAIADDIAVPLRVMIRENAGFETNASEWRSMRAAIEQLSALDVRDLAVVIGFAREGVPLIDDVARALEGMDGVRATFHRAFDTLTDPLAAIDAIARLPQIDRILTSGGACGAATRAVRLRSYTERAGTRLTIVAGGGVDEETLAILASSGCVKEVHVGR